MSVKVQADDPALLRFVEVFRGCGLNTSAAARELGWTRSKGQRYRRRAEECGLLGEEETAEANPAAVEAYLSARERKIKAFQQKQAKGAWDKLRLVNLPEGPFRLKLFGDPHMDSDAFDVDLWERHWFELNPANRVYGVCIGDWFNNWTKSLAHLWKEDGDPSDAWTLFEHYMHRGGAGLIGGCSGNHDDWTHAPADPIDLMMKRHGVVYRRGAVRLLLQCGPHTLTVALRHKWRGQSMYSPAHGLRRAAAEGWHDNIMVGGHIHQDEDRHYVVPRSGFVCHLFMVSAFKKFDDYADVHGFRPHATEPVRDLVVDPRRADTDPDKVVAFMDSDLAAGYLDNLRSRA